MSAKTQKVCKTFAALGVSWCERDPNRGSVTMSAKESGVILLRTGVALGILLISMTLPVADAAGAAAYSYRVGVLATGEFCQTYIAQKKDLFAKNGLDVQWTHFQGGSGSSRPCSAAKSAADRHRGAGGGGGQASGRGYSAPCRRITPPTGYFSLFVIKKSGRPSLKEKPASADSVSSSDFFDPLHFQVDGVGGTGPDHRPDRR